MINLFDAMTEDHRHQKNKVNLQRGSSNGAGLPGPTRPVLMSADHVAPATG